MNVKAETWLQAPNIKNISCSHPRYHANDVSFFNFIGPLEIIQALLIIMLTVGIIGANLLLIVVINHRQYSPYIHPQPRYLLTSLALNDFAIGLLITPFGILPALFSCWPYGEIFCQIQAMLRGALSQQSAVILVCMAIDRYLCAMYPDKYYQHSSKKGCVVILSLTWSLCLTMFGFLVLPKGYYFNNTGLLACEPFYSKPSYRILATCAFYFPTTMILMYCYGSSFHASRLGFGVSVVTTRAPISATHHSPIDVAATESTTVLRSAQQGSGTVMVTPPPPPSTSDKMLIQEQRLSGSASRTMAAMSLGFIVMVTPWTIQEVVAACTGSKVPPFLDFFVTWTAISNSFWNPFLYWLLNAHFRRLGRTLLQNCCCYHDDNYALHKRRLCCSTNSDCDANVPHPPDPPTSLPPQSDLDCLSDKYWGEILERTVSSNSIRNPQKSYGERSPHNSIMMSSIHFMGSDLHLTVNNGGMCMSNSGHTNLSNLSNSEPHLCEYFEHDADCARSKAFRNENRH